MSVPIPDISTHMTAKEFREIRATLKLSIYKLGDRLGVSSRTVQRCQNGEMVIPGPTAISMRFILAEFEKAEAQVG